MMPKPAYATVRTGPRRTALPIAGTGAPRRPPVVFPGHPLFRFLLINALGGFVVAFIFVGGLLWFDVLGFASLVARSESGLLAVAVVTFGMCVTFGSAAMGGAVMMMDYDHRAPDEGGEAQPD